MKSEIGIPFVSLNLAGALQDDEGTFLCHNGGQSYIVEAAPGHSIVSGPTPVGPRVQQLPQNTAGSMAEPWTITKIDHKVLRFGRQRE